MLTQLRIKDLAIIDDLTISFDPGFTVLTGETGAGKSIVVGALSLLLGERSRSDQVRTGCDRAMVEGTFFTPQSPSIIAALDEAGIQPDDNDVLVLRREVQASGRSRAWINGFNISINTLTVVGGQLAAIHGQHESRAFLDAESQRDALDEYAKAEDLQAAVKEAFNVWKSLERDVAELQGKVQRGSRKLAELQRLTADIDSAKLKPTEEEELDSEARRLEHAVELVEASERAAVMLEGDDVSVLSLLSQVRRLIETLARIDPATEPLSAQLESAHLVLSDLASELNSYALSVEADPARLAVVNERRALIHGLLRKYGGNVSELLTLADAARQELQLVEQSDDALAELRRRCEHAQRTYEQKCEALSRVRHAAANELSERISEVVPQLGMSGASFVVDVSPLSEPNGSGTDRVTFMIGINAGHERRELSRIASGGELSRVMLALKSVLAGVAWVPALVFDEVDAGIGGEIALRVGDALRELSSRHQVIVVTHLAQIAARASAHVVVSKDVIGGVTRAYAASVQGSERIEEVARMLAGEGSSATALSHAAEMLASTGRAVWFKST